MDSFPTILKIDSGGRPVSWIPWQAAVVLYARQRVCWEAGEQRFLIRGGINARTGRQSEIRIGSIIAVTDRSRRLPGMAPVLTNRTLFERDRHLCMYCGRRLPATQLTRDHVLWMLNNMIFVVKTLFKEGFNSSNTFEMGGRRSGWLVTV